MKIDWYRIGGAVLGAAAGTIAGPLGIAVGATMGYVGGGWAEPSLKRVEQSIFAPAKASPFSAPAPADKKAAPLTPQPATAAMAPDVVKAAAINMNTALGTNGYKVADQPLYTAFQKAAGLKSDGLPGKVTMSKLKEVLDTNGVAMASVKIYSWEGGYDGVSAPNMQEWTGNPNFSGPSPLVSQNPMPTASQVAASIPVAAGTQIKTIQDVQRALNQLGYGKPPLVADGVSGPKTEAATKAFQAAAGLATDGIPGPQVMAALSSAIGSQAAS